ncbi:MAG: Uncharacterized protein K0R26_2939 [Bacteroidota bacterium]|jgi:hypothetical protein|nr:Uncharacterized protein [Bacteroidota bacterium]
MYETIILSPFIEHPIVDVAHADPNEFDVTVFEEGQPSHFLLKGKFDKHLYCRCLLHKLFTLTKSQIKPFIHYQCSLVQQPMVWINKLEKLIDLNRELFTTKEQQIKTAKALLIIELLREGMERKVPAASRRFDFALIKSKLKTYETAEEQICFLYEAQAEYLQNKPAEPDPHSIPFDEKCAIEINKIERQSRIRTENLAKASARRIKPANSNRMVISGHINILVDAFYQMLHEKKTNGQPYLMANASEITKFIVCNFLDKDGQPLSEATVRTMLSPNKADKRPKANGKVLL